MKLKLIFLTLLICPLAFAQGVKQQFATTNTPIVVSNAVKSIANTGTNIGIFSTNADLFVRFSVPNSNAFSDSVFINSGVPNLVSNSTATPTDSGDPTWNSRWNTAFGVRALRLNTIGSLNTAIGSLCLASNTTGVQNTALGAWAGVYNTVGYHNTFLGVGAGMTNTTGFYNTFLGTDVGLAMIDGDHNTAVGAGALNASQHGVNNVAVGSTAGNMITGDGNVIVGTAAGIFNVTGGFNSILGHQALQTATSGNWNNAFGLNAGFNMLSGDSNIFIGPFSDVLTSARTNLANSIAIGSGLKLDASNEILIGNTQAVKTIIRPNLALITTNLGINTLTPTNTLHVYSGGETTPTAIDSQAAIGPGLMLENNPGGATIDNSYLNFWAKTLATDNDKTWGASRILGGWPGGSFTSWSQGYLVLQTHGANTAQWSNTLAVIGNSVALNTTTLGTAPRATLDVSGDVLTTRRYIMPTNYVAADFVPISGMVFIAPSNGVLYKVTQLSTNLVGAGTP